MADGISIVFDVNGIISLHHNWRTISVSPVPMNAEVNSIITVERATEILLEVYGDFYRNRSSVEPVYVSKAHLLRNGVISPVWVFSEEHDLLNMIMIDAITGEIVF